MKFINTLHEGDVISEIYFCKQKTAATTKAGKNYYSLTLQDKTGTVDAKIWDLNNGIEHFDQKDFIYIEAAVTSFNNALQLNVKRLRRANEGEYMMADYMPCSEFSTEDMYAELRSLIDSVAEPHLKSLLKSFFEEDREFAAKFAGHSAAKSIHHGFVGGLLQHTLSVAKLSDYLASAYPIINRDLLITAAIFHDIGKVDELSEFPENDYTDDGNLMGHIVIGAMMVRDAIKEMDDFPEELGKELIHCILAHHGELEFGSPKKPALIEALALSMADNLDAKLETFTETLNAAGPGKNWLGFTRQFDSNIRRT